MMPSDDKLLELADSIARDLFTNGFKERAERLVLLNSSKRDLGGWSEAAVAGRIYKALLAAFESKPGK